MRVNAYLLAVFGRVVKGKTPRDNGGVFGIRRCALEITPFGAHLEWKWARIAMTYDIGTNLPAPSSPGRVRSGILELLVVVSSEAVVRVGGAFLHDFLHIRKRWSVSARG